MKEIQLVVIDIYFVIVWDPTDSTTVCSPELIKT